MAKAFVVAVAVALLSACNRCDAPDQTTYSCTAVEAGSPGCQGDPGRALDAGINPDQTFPVGCVARLPYCNGYYGNAVQTCTCGYVPGPGTAVDAGEGWICPV